MVEKSIMVPFKCTKVVRNKNWSEREEEVIIEKSTKNFNVIQGTISPSVSVLADEKICLDLKINQSKHMDQS